jgi:hypothetical protein
MMQIVIETTCVTDNFLDEGSNSFTNRKNFTSVEVEKIFKEHNFGSNVVPSLYYMADLGNNPNIFTPPDGRDYFVQIHEVSLCYILPQDCYETGKDIEDLLLLVTKGLRDEDKVVELINKAFVELDQRMLWMTDLPNKEKFKEIPGLAAIVNKRLKKK